MNRLYIPVAVADIIGSADVDLLKVKGRLLPTMRPTGSDESDKFASFEHLEIGGLDDLLATSSKRLFPCSF